MNRRKLARGTPYVKTSVMVLGEDQIDAFEALCSLRGRQPHQLAADIVLDFIKAEQKTPEVQSMVQNAREFRAEMAQSARPVLRVVK